MSFGETLKQQCDQRAMYDEIGIGLLAPRIILVIVNAVTVRGERREAEQKDRIGRKFLGPLATLLALDASRATDASSRTMRRIFQSMASRLIRTFLYLVGTRIIYAYFGAIGHMNACDSNTGTGISCIHETFGV